MHLNIFDRAHVILEINWPYSIKLIQGGKLKLQVLRENLQVLLESEIIALVSKNSTFLCKFDQFNIFFGGGGKHLLMNCGPFCKRGPN